VPLSERSEELVPTGALERLTDLSVLALESARKTGLRSLASVTFTAGQALDPAAAVLLGSTGSLDWTILDQPDNERSSIAGLGTAAALGSSGAGRFATVAAEWRDLAGRAVMDDPRGPAGTGPIAIGGFSFSDSQSGAGPWSAYGAASMHVPTLALRRLGSDTWVSLQVCPDPDDSVESLLDGVSSAVNSLNLSGDLAGLVPADSANPPRISSVLSPAHYESAVSGALEAVAEGRITKVVLAREVLVEREAEHDPAAVFAVLREAFPSCFNYAVSRGESVFIGASPELLVRREGARATTIALAGSAPRSADPAVDDHIGERLMRSEKDRREQGIVTERIMASLNPFSVWLAASPEPSIAKVANIQHLASPIRAQLRESVSTLDLLGALHPTPAVGGEPWSEASQVMSEVEGMDRGWYAAPVGWTDLTEDGEFCVALRGALLNGSQARCYAGVGVVEGSDPALELAETELKLQAVLPVLSV